MSDIIELMERRFRALGLQVAVGDRFIEVDGVGTGGDLLRGELQLNGAKAGWCLGQCGACTVMVDGEAIFSCLTPVVALQRWSHHSRRLGTERNPSLLRRAFIKEQAAQCGNCTAGMIMRAQAQLERMLVTDGSPDGCCRRR